MLSRDEHDNLVGVLYASATGEVPWLAAIRQLATAFDVSGSVIRMTDASGRVLGFATYPYPEEFSANFFAGEIFRADPRFKAFANVRPGSIYYDRALYDVEAMNRDPRVRACNDALNANYSLGAVASLPAGATVSVALLSTEAEGHASATAIRAFRRLAPHMRQAFSLGQIVEQRAATQAALLDALAYQADGVILLNRAGTPSFMNDTAQAILAAGDGLAFSHGQFVARRGPETRRLRQLIGDAIRLAPPSESRPGGDMLVTRSGGRRPYVVRVMPAPPTERFLSGLGIACVIHLHDLAAMRVPTVALLGAAFGLSQREAELAIALVRCAGLASAAANVGMALNTARNHLQSIFRKSGTASQAEAVQLFSRLG